MPIPEFSADYPIVSTGEPIDLLSVEMGSDYRIPEEAVPQAAQAVLKTLGHLGIDPQTVLISGHAGESADPDADKSTDPAIEYFLSQDVDDEYLDYDAADAQFVQERTSDLHQYFMSPASALLHEEGEYDNPLHYAGTTESAQLVVYDLAELRRLFPDESDWISPQFAVQVQATQDLLEPAVRARIHPRYRPMK